MLRFLAVYIVLRVAAGLMWSTIGTPASREERSQARAIGSQ
jgi:hypothetical protein